MSIIIRTHELSFVPIITYPQINITEGETTFIQGESGCGKSTLLKLFNATLSPIQGDILYQGQNISKLDTVSLRKEVLLVSQDVFLFSGSIEENFNQYYSYRDLPPISKEQINKYLSLCCVEFPFDVSCDKMSGGEKQRIFIAIFLSFMPKVLMLDEPTSALDETTSDLLLSNIKSFCKGNHITSIIISHDKKLSQKYADEIITLKREIA